MAAADRLTGRRIAVVGAGWAGLSAAAGLVAAGARVTLVERAGHPGGRAFSFHDRRTGLILDNGQHVILGCCERFVAHLSASGQEDAATFQTLLDIPLFSADRWQRIRSARLPGSLHLLPGLLRYGHLPLRERLKALRAGRALGDRSAARRAEGLTFGEFLRAHGQSERVIRLLWEPVVIAVMNARADEVCAGQAIEALRTGFAAGPQAARLGNFHVPLGDVASAAVRRLQGMGVTVTFGRTVSALEVRDGAVTGLLYRDGATEAFDAVVSAVPADALLALLPEPWPHAPPFERLKHLAWNPILNLYLLYDRPVMDMEVAAFGEGTAQFVFNRGRLQRTPSLDGRLLAVSISAAGPLRGVPADTLSARVEADIAAGFARAAGARVLDRVTVWQPHATFAAGPQSRELRAGARTILRGFYLAGDWTDTGWPACLEGAVRSGETAVRALLEDMQTTHRADPNGK